MVNRMKLDKQEKILCEIKQSTSLGSVAILFLLLAVLFIYFQWGEYYIKMHIDQYLVGNEKENYYLLLNTISLFMYVSITLCSSILLFRRLVSWRKIWRLTSERIIIKSRLFQSAISIEYKNVNYCASSISETIKNREAKESIVENKKSNKRKENEKNTKASKEQALGQLVFEDSVTHKIYSIKKISFSNELARIILFYRDKFRGISSASTVWSE